jgi:hypothetical protein
MGRPSRIISLILFATGGFLTLDLPALADPSFGMAWAGYPTVTIGLKTLGIGSLIVFAIEALVIRALSGMSWGKSLIASVVINIGSTIVGLLAWWLITGIGIFSIGCFLILGIAALGIFISYKNGWFGLIVAAAIILGSWGMRNMNNLPWASTWAIWACILYQILLGFGLSLGSEILYAGSRIPKRVLVKTILLANIASYIFIILVAPFYWPNPVVQRYSYEKRGIRSIWGTWSPQLRGSFISTPESIFQAHYRMNLSTPQLLGIKKAEPPIEMKDEKEFIELVLFTLFHNSGLREEEDYRDNFLIFLDLAFQNFKFSDDAAKVLEWVKITVARWPEIFKAADEGRAEDFHDLFEEWKRQEKQIGLDNPPVMMSSITNRDPLRRDEPFTKYVNDWVSPILYSINEKNGMSPEVISVASELYEKYGYYYDVPWNDEVPKPDPNESDVPKT